MKYVVHLCTVCDGCCVFCLNCGAAAACVWKVYVFSHANVVGLCLMCILWQSSKDLFYMTWSLLMLVMDASVSFCFPHAVVVSGFIMFCKFSIDILDIREKVNFLIGRYVIYVLLVDFPAPILSLGSVTPLLIVMLSKQPHSLF